ncbi:amino acid transporter [Nocardia cyriacigeorgica]|uniref:Amino acid transporter n=1 Tax=Nocardia cyriacigeorgica TaxID=135487 RepID=A0A6P1CTF6_9NOCA|nr:LysE/ArgO family amino acid transporter [Nocardia cyriacigeorgica]NEW33425.1 amino acid transporter [Nocardia cyriacigeorgica]
MNSGIFPAAFAGFGAGLSLIVAIGAQNAFVLRQGARGHAVPVVVAISAISDALLIALGVAGFGSVITAWPAALTVAGLAGGAFLICYGAMAARRALRPTANQALTSAATSTGTLRKVVLTCLAMTWLNPHAYIDTVLLLGTVASQRGSLRWIFGLGAMLASLTWFISLGYGARLLGPILARPKAWRILDTLVATTMLTMGTALIVRTGFA